MSALQEAVYNLIADVVSLITASRLRHLVNIKRLKPFISIDSFILHHFETLFYNVNLSCSSIASEINTSFSSVADGYRKHSLIYQKI